MKITKMRGKPIWSFIYVFHLVTLSSFFNKTIKSIIVFVLLGFIYPNMDVHQSETHCISDFRCCFEKLVGRLTYYARATKSREEASQLLIFFIFNFITPKPLTFKDGE